MQQAVPDRGHHLACKEHPAGERSCRYQGLEQPAVAQQAGSSHTNEKTEQDKCPELPLGCPMLFGVTLVCVSVSRIRERGAMMAMAAERASRPRRVGRMTRMPRVVSKAPQGHDHEARCPERKAKRIRIHDSLPTERLHDRGACRL